MRGEKETKSDDMRQGEKKMKRKEKIRGQEVMRHKICTLQTEERKEEEMNKHTQRCPT